MKNGDNVAKFWLVPVSVEYNYGYNGFVTDETIQHVRKILKDREFVEEMTEHNYQLGKQFYSFTVLERQLQILLHSCFSRERPD